MGAMARPYTLQRFKRAQSRETWADDEERLRYQDMFSRLLHLCHGVGVRVTTFKGANAFFRWTDQSISLSVLYGSRRVLHTFLHELGHYCVDMDSSVINLRYPRHVSVKTARSVADRVAIVDEEFEAWYRARQIVEVHGFNLRQGEFDALESRCLRRYAQWLGSDGRPAPKKRKKKKARS